MEIIDIAAKGDYPANVLSNFSPNAFTFDGVECASMEGFLQSLKYRSAKRQRKICRLTGKDAKNAGKRKFLWKITGKVYWQGRRYSRFGKEFETLLFGAYRALATNETFLAALLSAEGKELKHTLGKHDRKKTILTEEEFLACLNFLRNDIAQRG